MADNSSRVANFARILAIGHIVVGALLIIFGIADRAVVYRHVWTGYVGFGIWTGIWMCITGSLGIPGSSREMTNHRNCFGGVYMGFSITSAVFGGIIIINYSLAIAVYRYDYRYDYDRNYYYYSSRYYYQRNYEPKMAILSIILVLSIAEFVMGIAAPVCLCLMKVCGCGGCDCCMGSAESQTQPGMYNTAGYVMTQGPTGVPVAVPVQGGYGMAPLQAPYAQANQPPMVAMPAPGQAGGQPLMAQATAPAPVPDTVSFPQGETKLPPYA